MAKKRTTAAKRILFRAKIRQANETTQAYKSVLVICLPRINAEQRDVIQRNFSNLSHLKNNGWLFLVIDGFEKMDVRAFGVPESKLGEYEELKALIEEKLKQNNG